MAVRLLFSVDDSPAEALGLTRPPTAVCPFLLFGGFLFHSVFLRVPAPLRETLFQPIHAAGDTTLENGLPEVQEGSELQTLQPQIRPHLLFMRWQDPFNRLQLQEHQILDDNVSPEPLIESDPL